ncbi:kinase-like domain-containing protein [Pilobolus umbonatus]|nr:kinase-like domain-containing protein [Pilobolus umbonatus]
MESISLNNKSISNNYLSCNTEHLSPTLSSLHQPHYQDTNYIGITINDDPKQTNTPSITTSTSATTSPTHNNTFDNIHRHPNYQSHTHSRTASIPTLNNTDYSPTYTRYSFPRYNSNSHTHDTQIILEEEPHYFDRIEYSGAFRIMNPEIELPYFPSRVKEDKHHGVKPLLSLTVDLKATYHACNHSFQYNATNNPRRVLTKPSKASKNDGYDNDDFDYILYVNDILGSTEGHNRYLILDVLGSGTFGQVVKCRNIKTQEIVAVKVVKNKLAYFKQSMMEVAILEMLNQRYDPDDKHHLLRLKDTFIHKKHLCLVFELLSVNLYELLKQNHYRGLSTNLVRVFTAQILDALTVLNEARIIHCDLKPENILLKNLESPTIKVIDFGSACHEVQTMYTYIQSRFYRSPEVLVGLPYTSAIDMWSLGCIATELFLGLPLFPGSSEYNQLARIIEMLGTPPNYMIDVGKNAHRYFHRTTTPMGKTYEFKSLEEYSREQGKLEQPSKRYFTAKTLPDLINSYPIMRKAQMTLKEIDKEKQNRLAFIDFLQGLLNLNPIERWSPQQAKQHPFITGEKFTGPFQPPFIPRKQHHMAPSINIQNECINTYRTTPKNYPDPFLSPTYSSLPNHYPTDINQKHKRAPYNPPLPSVIEPPHNYQQSHHLDHQPDFHPHPISQLSMPPNGNVIGSGRPRANTVGTMQVPPQIQWAAAEHGNIKEGSLYSPYHPYKTDQNEFNKVESMHSRTYMDDLLGEDGDSSLLPRWGMNNGNRMARQTVDLERDGDWQEEPRKVTHRRSNSSIRYSDASLSSSVTAGALSSSHARSSLHRLMRGNPQPYGRQDLEWDGVVHPTSAQLADYKNNELEEDKWNKDQVGWMQA